MQNKLYCGMLNAYYGSMLTPHQYEVLNFYYDRDMSLAEISEYYGVSRQAVREIIVRATDKLLSYEKKLGLIEKVQHIADKLEKIISTVDGEDAQTTKNALSELLTEIREI